MKDMIFVYLGFPTVSCHLKQLPVHSNLPDKYSFSDIIKEIRDRRSGVLWKIACGLGMKTW